MYLYEKEGNHINIYTLKASKQRLTYYKEKLIKEQINNGNLFYTLKTENEDLIKRFIEHNDISYNEIIENLSLEPLNNSTNAKYLDINNLIHENLIVKYTNGNFPNYTVTRVYDSINNKKSIYNFLIPFFYETNYDKYGKNIYFLKSIMSIPQQLVNLYQIEKSHCINTPLNYEEQLKLFELIPYNQVPFEIFKTLEHIKNLNDTQINNMISSNEKVLKKIKPTWTSDTSMFI